MVGLDSQAEQHFSTVSGIRINMLHFLCQALYSSISGLVEYYVAICNFEKRTQAKNLRVLLSSSKFKYI